MAEPSKFNGQYNSAMGSTKEAVGGAIESLHRSAEPSSLRAAGARQHARGEAELDAAKTQGYVEGLGDRFEGKKDAVVGAITGDRSQQLSGNTQHEMGKGQMEINKCKS